MKQKTLIQIWGRYAQGKTTTIRVIREELEKKYINPSHSYSLPLPSGENYDIFSCNGYLVGISSMGDNLTDDLKNHLDNCFAKCDLIIAASRMYNNVDDYLKKKSKDDDFRRIKATNYRIEAPRTIQDDFSQESAKHIVELIDKIFKGIL